MTTEEYTRLTNLYMNDIYRVAFSGCRNWQDAEDITQEVFEALLRYEKQAFRDEEHVKRWLIRVTVNKCKSMWRTPWKRKVDLSDQEIVSAEIEWENEQEEQLFFALRKLPLKYAQIVHLFYFEDMKIKEIADVTGLSETAVATRLQRAREKLKTYLEESGL